MMERRMRKHKVIKLFLWNRIPFLFESNLQFLNSMYWHLSYSKASTSRLSNAFHICSKELS